MGEIEAGARDPAVYEPGSFRDRSGRVFRHGGGVFRAVDAEALVHWEHVATTRFHADFRARGRIVDTVRLEVEDEPPLSDRAAWAAILRHERVPFVSYPYEWCFGMLRDAALLQLDLLLAAIGEDVILKDATPYNVQWVGTEPVFIDTASFTRLEPGAPWVGYRQFCELFLYPLLLQAWKGTAFQPWLRGRLEGIPAGEMAALLSWRDLVRAGALVHVVLQAKAQARLGEASGEVRSELARAGFHAGLIVANVRRLRSLVEHLIWSPGESAWTGYAQSHSYSEPGIEAKRAFVHAVASAQRRALVWDVGANTGTFSQVVAPYADTVVAMDRDHATVERLYRALRADKQRTILPLVIDLADPSPGLGWQGRERLPLGDRGRPDLVLALALLHHLVIAAHVPLPEVVAWLLGLGEEVVVEFVGRDDPMVRLLLANKGMAYADYDQQHFEQLLEAGASLVRREEVPGGTRTLYHVRPGRR